MKKFLKGLGVVLAVAIVFAGGYTLGLKKQEQGGLSAEFAERYAEIEELLDKYCYWGADEKTLHDGALHGMVDALGDRFTSYYNEEEFMIYNENMSESYSGIGVVISLNYAGLPMASQVYEGSPAEKAGVKDGDVFVAINGKAIEPGTDISLVSMTLRGEKGTTVDVTLQRGETTLETTIIRDTVKIRYVQSEMLTDRIGYVYLSEFSSTCDEEVKEAVEALQKKGMTKLVLDMRDNGGGYVDSSLEMADLFMEGGVMLIVEDYNEFTDTYHATPGKFDLEVVLLVNGNSASATEIFAGAMQDNEAAVIVGTKTYGKGIMQMMYPLSWGGGLNITIAGNIRPNGEHIHKNGITPDYIVELPDEVMYGLEPLTRENDTQLQKALELLK
ncbi:MAG: S41 family peptidase [Clostridia bacterium]|nr:S41 family peptidase [Clostridia bacterium]